jgi:alkylated DNA nucleotide flippase Atl1
MAIVPPWKSPYTELPVNNQVVWIRVLSMYGQIVLAQYKESRQQFETIDTEISIPVYMISRWRTQ